MVPPSPTNKSLIPLSVQERSDLNDRMTPVKGKGKVGHSFKRKMAHKHEKH